MIRPMRLEDAGAAHALAVETFEAYARSRNEAPEPRPDPVAVRPRYERLARSDPGGAWVAEEGGRLTGCAISILREGVWGLSLFIVHPERQSAGLGRELLRRAHDYADGARGRIILSSRDPRALRAYAGLGLTGHPAFWASGIARDVAEPEGVREATPDDLPFLDDVSRHARGAAHGDDLRTLWEMGATILLAEGRGFAVTRGGGPVRLLAAYDDAGAQDVLRAVLARSQGHVAVEWLTAKQAWAVPVCLEAGLELRTDTGPVFTGGDVGPFAPYLPSGAFL
ncbi:GNAT family N-acetyltransferase [Candidatus Solirubrobacter pratensis]|uniref:GNAT family N-acetyltransferase n=1 Tax=Candidatus Solirubrobacter pratensis TaxID=1298857 RepID=UPI00040A3CDF|nr:GNAT family N-acetyltransferase [Candidatus Solirubrobacter pratensis]